MLSHQQFKTFLEMQIEMNNRVDPLWMGANYPFLRAALMEANESIEHHGWKWWKKQEKDLPALQMEMVDIWHFLLSAYLIQNEGKIEETAKELKAFSESQIQSVDFDGKIYIISSLNTVDKLELLIGLAASRRISIPLYSALLKDCEMTWDDLFRQYLGKNVLNCFRQDKGYKEGSYRKTWLGCEDNVHLSEIILKLDGKAEDFRKQIYSHLNERYMGS